MRHFTMIFFIIIFSATGFLYLIKAGWYPAAIVNSKVIWARTINKEMTAALYYYKKTTDVALSQPEVRRATIENMIEKIDRPNTKRRFLEKRHPFVSGSCPLARF